MDNLQVPLIFEIAKFVGIRSFLRVVSLLNRRYRDLFKDSADDFYKVICTEPTPGLRLTVLKKDFKCNDWRSLATQLMCLSEDIGEGIELDLDAFEESSSDHHSQNIPCCLDHSMSFWSSKGDMSSASNDYLIFNTYENTIISELSISFYQALYQLGKPCYASQYIQISVGFDPLNYYYKSELFAVENTPFEQIFRIGPEAIYGTHVRIDFIAKVQTQAPDGKFYCCVRNVQLRGLHIPSLVEFYPVVATHLQEVPENESKDDHVKRFELARKTSQLFKILENRWDEEALNRFLFSEDPRSNAFYLRLRQSWLKTSSSTPKVIVDHLRAVGSLNMLTPLESVLLIEANDSYINADFLCPCEEVGDYLFNAGHPERAIILYSVGHDISDQISASVRLAVDKESHRDFIISLAPFDEGVIAHILSLLIRFYDRHNQPRLSFIRRASYDLVRLGRISEQLVHRAFSEIFPSPIGLDVVHFEKPVRPYEQYLFVLSKPSREDDIDSDEE